VVGFAVVFGGQKVLSVERASWKLPVLPFAFRNAFIFEATSFCTVRGYNGKSQCKERELLDAVW